jgi:hypothetical protein
MKKIFSFHNNNNKTYDHMNIKPIKPDEMRDRKNQTIPNELIQSINELLVKNWGGSRAVFKQSDIIDKYNELCDKTQPLCSILLSDVKDVYRQLGWIVDNHLDIGCDYDETFEEYVIFSKKTK